MYIYLYACFSYLAKGVYHLIDEVIQVQIRADGDVRVNCFGADRRSLRQASLNGKRLRNHLANCFVFIGVITGF